MLSLLNSGGANSKKILIHGLGSNPVEEKLRQYFQQYGVVEKVFIFTNSNKAIVKYLNHEACRSCLAEAKNFPSKEYFENENIKFVNPPPSTKDLRIDEVPKEATEICTFYDIKDSQTCYLHNEFGCSSKECFINHSGIQQKDVELPAKSFKSLNQENASSISFLELTNIEEPILKPCSQEEKEVKKLPLTNKKEYIAPLANGLKTVELAEGDRVMVSHVINPHSFYIQMLDDIEFLDSPIQQKKLFSSETFTPNDGDLGTFYDSERKLWFRVEVCKVQGKTCQIFYLDYGQTVETKIDKLNKIPEEFSIIPKKAIKCQLHGVLPVDSEWSETTIGIFNQLVEEDIFSVSVKNINKSRLIDVDMKNSRGDQLKDIIISLGYAVSDSACSITKRPLVESIFSSLMVGENVTLHITHLQKDTIFAITSSSQKELEAYDQIYQDLQENQHQLLPTELCTPGALIVAFSNYFEKWFRAQVLESSKELKVLYIDYGNQEFVANVALLKTKWMSKSFVIQYLCSSNEEWTNSLQCGDELSGNITDKNENNLTIELSVENTSIKMLGQPLIIY